MVKKLINFALFVVAVFLIFLLSFVNYYFVPKENRKGYFKSTARNLDIFANREYRAMWNALLITKDGYKFGKEGETLSSTLVINHLKETLSKKGMWLVELLNKFEENHFVNSIEN